MVEFGYCGYASAEEDSIIRHVRAWGDPTYDPSKITAAVAGETAGKGGILYYNSSPYAAVIDVTDHSSRVSRRDARKEILVVMRQFSIMLGPQSSEVVFA